MTEPDPLLALQNADLPQVDGELSLRIRRKAHAHLAAARADHARARDSRPRPSARWVATAGVALVAASHLVWVVRFMAALHP